MRWVIRILGFVVVMAGLGLGALVLMPADRIAALAAERLGASFGRPVTLSGVVRPTLWPHLGVRDEEVVVCNPDWASEGPLITAEALTIRVPWAALFSQARQIDEITLVSPDITLVRAADGRTSWSMPTANPGAPSGSLGPAFGITAAQITGGSVRVIDHTTQQDLRISGLDLRLELPLSGPATVAGQARINGAALGLEAEIASLPHLMDGGLSAVALALDWSGGTGRFEGQMGLAPVLDGHLSVVATDLAPLLALLGAAMPDLPDGLGRDRLELSGQITFANARSAHLRGGRLMLDETELALALDLIPGDERPLIRGTVEGARVSLPQSTGTEATGGDAGWSTAPIDVAGLFAADAEIALALGGLDGAGMTLGPIDLRATLTRGRLVVDIARIGIHDGTLGGQFVVNGRGGLSLGGDLRLSDVQLLPLLSELADYDRLEGTGSASLRFLGVGSDLATLMRSLSGDGDLALGAGAILGLDLPGMIRTLDPAHRGEGASTAFDRVSGSFTIVSGVVSNEDLRLDAAWGEVTGRGQVDLGAQRLEYRLIPGILSGSDGSALRVPILVSGPWANPSIRPDLEYLAQQELAEERARLQAEAQARLDAEVERLENEARARAAELVGTELDQDSTLDDARDALEQRLRDEAEQQLLRLLGQGN